MRTSCQRKNMFCTKCGTEMPNDANNCPNCGQPTNLQQGQNAQQPYGQQYGQPQGQQYGQQGQRQYYGQQQYYGQRPQAGPYTSPASNLFGLIGFIIALVSIFLVAVPVLNFILVFAGLGLSIFGLVIANRDGLSKGLSIAGMVIAIIMLVIAIIYTSVMSVFSGVGSLVGGMMSFF